MLPITVVFLLLVIGKNADYVGTVGGITMKKRGAGNYVSRLLFVTIENTYFVSFPVRSIIQHRESISQRFNCFGILDRI